MVSEARTVFILGGILIGLVLVTSQPLLGVVILPVVAGLLVGALERWFQWVRPLERPRRRDPLERRRTKPERRRRPKTERGPVAATPTPTRTTETRMLVTAIATLVLLGLVMVWAAHTSPGSPYADERLGWTLRYLLWGTALAFALSKLGLDRLQRLTVPFLIVAIAILVAADADLIGHRSNGYPRIGVGNLAVEPAALTVLAMILFAAKRIATIRFGWQMQVDSMILLLLGAFPLLLLMFGASIGTTTIAVAVLLGLLLAAGARPGNLLLGVLPTMVPFTLLVLASPFRQERLLGFLDPWDDALGSGFQTAQSLIAVGSGGLFGRGPGESIQRALFLPEAEGDFVLAVAAEELGLLAILTVLLLVTMIAYAGLRTAMMERDRYRSLLTTGLTTLLVAPAIVNVFMVLGMAPASGVGLPFVSFGATGTLLSFATAGLLLGTMRTPREDPIPLRGRSNRQLTRRTGLLFGIVLIMVGAAAARSFWLDTFRSSDLAKAAAAQQTRVELEPGLRGTIFDRHGFVLALSRPAFDVVANPNSISNVALTAKQLKWPLRLQAGELRSLLTTDSDFVYLKRRLPSAAAEQVRELDVDGVVLLPTQRRVRPRGPIAAQTVGTVGEESEEGLTGAEVQFEKALGGVDGERLTVTNALGQPISRQTPVPSSRGEDLRLTLDAGLQEKVEAVLAETAESQRARSAAAVFVDPTTGEILASASWPSFDPSDLYHADPDHLLDRVIGFDYEPGSVLNPFPLVAALAEQLVSAETTLATPAEALIADRIVENRSGASESSVAGLIARLNDVGTALVALRLGPQRLASWLEKFGFGTATGVDLPGEHRGTIAAGTEPNIGAIGSLAVGRDLLATPLQIALAYSALTNGGLRPAARIVQRIGDEPVESWPVKRIVSPEIAALALRNLGADGQIAAAAPTVDPVTGLYLLDRQNITAVKFVPRSDPALVEVLVLDQAHTSNPSPASNALARINRLALPYLGIEGP